MITGLCLLVREASVDITGSNAALDFGSTTFVGW